jgi:apolipoprotein N-acyltransferase
MRAPFQPPATVRTARLIFLAWGLPFLLGAASVFGFAPFYLFPLPILALAGFLYLTRLAAPAEAMRRGWAFGLGWFLAGVSWVYVSLHDFGMMPAPLAALATLLFAAFLALFPAAAVWLTLHLRLAPAARWLLAMPALWTGLEWTRNWLFTGFPWQALGYAQAPFSPLAGYAPILGVFGVSWLAAVTAGAIVLGRRWAYGLAAGFWLAGAGLAQVAWTQPEGEPVTVSLLQGNVAQEMKFRPEKLVATLNEYRRLILASEARLIVTPETALPLFLEHLPAGYLDELAGPVRQRDGGLLVGVPEREGGRYYNSMLALAGGPPQLYRKVHLVPFGEFVPPGFGWIVDWLSIPLSDFARGASGQPPLALAGQRVAVNICYEDVFGEELIHALPAATLMVNVSNDAWFGRSFAPWQHLQISQMRALETGRWWLRANNTGITAILDEKGRVRAQLEPFRTGALAGEAQGFAGQTPYARWGNAVVVAVLLLALAAAWALQRRNG